MAMICVWYPKETGPGVSAKQVAKRGTNLNRLGQYLDGRLNVGHSSLLLDRLKRPAYISWWPQDPATDTPTWRIDVQEEGGNPNVMISLDDLDEDAMASWWDGIRARRTGARGNYDLVSYNCSSAVADALSAGGADALSPRPVVNMWTPARIEDWGNALVKAGKAKNNRIFRHEGMGNFVDATLRRMVSELGAGMLSP